MPDYAVPNLQCLSRDLHIADVVPGWMSPTQCGGLATGLESGDDPSPGLACSAVDTAELQTQTIDRAAVPGRRLQLHFYKI